MLMDKLAYLSKMSRNATGLLLRDMQKRGYMEFAYKNIRILNATGLLPLVQIGGEI